MSVPFAQETAGFKVMNFDSQLLLDWGRRWDDFDSTDFEEGYHVLNCLMVP